MIFLHGWPGIGLVWRAQVEAFATEGWHCIAPDMRGYGGSSAPEASEAYALKEIVDDMVELHDLLGAGPAIWVGHDLGSPVVGALAAHHAKRSRGVVFISVPYAPQAFALPSLLPLIDRKLYPSDQYPDGQWDYYRFYLTHFDQTVTDFDADIPASLAAIYRSGNPGPPWDRGRHRRGRAWCPLYKDDYQHGHGANCVTCKCYPRPGHQVGAQFRIECGLRDCTDARCTWART